MDEGEAGAEGHQTSALLHLISGLAGEPGAHFVVTFRLGNSPAHPQGGYPMVSSQALVYFPEWHTLPSGAPGGPLSITGDQEGQSSLSFGDDLHKMQPLPHEKLRV